MASCSSLLLSFLIYKVESVCENEPIDLNTATLSELDTLPFITSSSAQSIINIRPICSPLELASISSPIKIEGITKERLNTKWNWYSDKSCSLTCCKADASCTGLQPQYSSDTLYSWKTGPWSQCTADCNTGIQHRQVICSNSSTTVHNAFCSLNEAEPVDKQLCNTQKCPIYRWIEDKWSTCALTDGECIQTRSVSCYDTAYNTLSDDAKCTAKDKVTVQSCDKAQCKNRRRKRGKPHLSPRIDTSTGIGNDNANTFTATVDLLNEYNAEKCSTDSYYDVDDDTLITRRACSVSIEVSLDVAYPDVSTFYLDATLEADTDENVGDLFTDYLSFTTVDATTGSVTITIPSDGYIGKFDCTLYLSYTGVVADKVAISSFTLYVLFNPYSHEDDAYIPGITDRKEYIENSEGLVWVGSVTSNTARGWEYDQYNVKNLDVSIYLLRRLALQHRNDIVLIARQVSYAVGNDICYGNWGSYDYTTGKPGGGYRCSSSPQNCFEPWVWEGTTSMFELYDSMDREYKVQYCQCWVFAGVSTTVGRSLGIATRSVTNFQSAHDTDYNRCIEKYFKYSKWSKTWSETSGDTGDSVWNFHVWNDMYFRRNDFTDNTYNVDGWQAVDATPQEASYGGNPAVGNAGEYQMGPASHAMIKENKNPSDCTWAAPNRERFGCFDQEFVISEVNAYYNLWYKTSLKGSFTLYDTFEQNPWSGETYTSVGQQMSTKLPQDSISDDCANEAIQDCTADLLDVTLQYKDEEPSGAGEPTDKSNWYEAGDTLRSRRRLVDTAVSNSTDDIDFNGDANISWSVDLIPREWLSSMLIADDKDDIITLYDDDYTQGRISLHIHSFYDTTKYVYCGFMVTAHDYRGNLFKNTTNDTVKMDKMDFVLNAGESGECVFSLSYGEYSSLLDVVEKPYSLKFSVSVALYDTENDANSDFSMPTQSILEERMVLICSPKYKLHDRIICLNGLMWIEPSYNLTYKCDGISGVHIESVGDGFCDEVNNVDPCFDGGDCCATSCIPSSQYKCERFNCTDDRVVFQNTPYYECPKALSFIDYMNSLLTDGLCVDLETSIIKPNLVCSKEIWDDATGNVCFDYVNAARDEYGDVKACLTQALNSIESEMREIIEWAIDCWYESPDGTTTTKVTEVTSKQDTDKKEDESKKDNTVVIAVIVLSVVAVLVIGALYYFFVQKKKSETGYDTPFMQLGAGNDNL